MAKRRYTKARTRTRTRYVTRTHRRARKTISVAKVGGFGVAVGAPAIEAYEQGGSPKEIAQNVMNAELKAFTGYDLDTKTWNPADAVPAYAEIGTGYLLHWLANKIGINRMLKKYKI